MLKIAYLLLLYQHCIIQQLNMNKFIIDFITLMAKCIPGTRPLS